MTNELQTRFNNAKSHMIMCIDKYETTEPTDKEVLEFMLSVAKIRLEEAIIEDMQGHERDWQIRIQQINEQLEAIHVNEQAEINKAVNRYEQGLGID